MTSVIGPGPWPAIGKSTVTSIRRRKEAPASAHSRGSADYLRVFSAVAIVWFHADTAPGRLWCSPGLVVFLMLSFMHASQPAPLLTVLRRRSQRVLIPWAFWWSIYAAIRIFRGEGIPAITSAWSVIAWPAIHLWYLPFLLIHSLALQACRPVLGRLPATTKESIALVVGMGLFLSLPLILFADLPRGANIWIASLPAACFGVALGSCQRPDRQGRLLRVGGIVICVAIASCYLLSQGLQVEAVGYGIGTAIAGLNALPVRRSRLMTKLSLLTPGIYFIHPLAFMVVWRFAPSPPPFWLFLLAGTVGGGAAAWVLKRNSLTRMLV